MLTSARIWCDGHELASNKLNGRRGVDDDDNATRARAMYDSGRVNDKPLLCHYILYVSAGNFAHTYKVTID